MAEQNIADKDTVQTNWRIRSLKLFLEALKHYKEKLEPHDLPNNDLIKQELEQISRMTDAFESHIKNGRSDYDMESMVFDGLYLKKLHSVLWMYKELKDHELAMQETQCNVRGALEYKQKELNEVAEVLSLPIWQNVERVELLVDDFANPKDKIPLSTSNGDQPVNKGKKSTDLYITHEIISRFATKQDAYNYKKLIGLLTELNSNYSDGNAYACYTLIRAILDHIPPLLGQYSFKEVVENYSWGETDKKYMAKLLDFRNEADDILHRQISSDPEILDLDDLPPSNRIERLLSECLSNGGKTLMPKLKNQSELKPRSSIKVSLVSKDVKWANWGMKSFIWSSYQIELKIDNYDSKIPDYVSVLLEAKLKDGETWRGTHFIFYGVDKQDEEFRIEEHEQKNVTVFISNQTATSEKTVLPEIEQGSMILFVNTRSGAKIQIPISDELIKRG